MYLLPTDDIEKLTTPSTSNQATKRKEVIGRLLVIIFVVYIIDVDTY